MSKDMLGSLVRASVKLSQPQLNLSVDVMNRFTGENGAAWEAHMKSILRSGLPNQGKQETASKPSVLILANDSVQLDAVASNDPHAFFKTRTGLWVSDDFKSRILTKAKPVENLDPAALSSYGLKKYAYDKQITPELGENYIFDESELCARIEQMISKQPNGEEGDLLNNGYWNIFYVAGCVVSVDWGSDDREWDVGTWNLGGSRGWGAGCRVFSRN